MLVSRLWEERRLAYPIKGHRRGTYWLTYFRLESGRLAEVERQCQLNDSILRKLFLKVDPRIVDTLVAHTQSPSSPVAGVDQGEKASGPEAAAPQKGDEAAGDADKPDVSPAAEKDSP